MANSEKEKKWDGGVQVLVSPGDPVLKSTVTPEDCVHHIKTSALLQQIKPKLIYCDPPHNIGQDYGRDGDNKPICDDLSDDDYRTWCYEWLDPLVEIMPVNGTLLLFPPVQHRCYLEHHCRETLQLFLASEIIWGFGFGQNNHHGTNFTPAHMTCLRLVKHRKKCVFHGDNPELQVTPWRAINKDTRFVKRRDEWIAAGKPIELFPFGKVLDDFLVVHQEGWDATFRSDHDVLCPPRVCGTHKGRQPVPNQHPMVMAYTLIRLMSRKGDTVLDPFAGSGTAGVAAVHAGRNYKGFDRNPNFVKLAKERIATALSHREEELKCLPTEPNES